MVKDAPHCQSISIHAPPRGATGRNHCVHGGKYFNSRPSARGDVLRRIKRCNVDISIHAPPRGATYDRRDVMEQLGFQFTPLREGRRDKHERDYQQQNFNSRPSARGDARETPTRGMRRAFQFTPLREGRPVAAVPYQGRDGFQFTPLREGRQKAEALKLLAEMISIHAPPRGATCRFACCFLSFCISIHAPPRGATEHARSVVVLIDISIHAPPRGATSRPASRPAPSAISIHAPPRGATSRHFWMATRFAYFNSRPSARGDSADQPADQHHQLFQFTPLREGRPLIISGRVPQEIFQFTPLREGRHQHHQPTSTISYFNSRPSARGDTRQNRAILQSQDFNSRPSARGDVHRP